MAQLGLVGACVARGETQPSDVPHRVRAAFPRFCGGAEHTLHTAAAWGIFQTPSTRSLPTLRRVGLCVGGYPTLGPPVA